MDFLKNLKTRRTRTTARATASVTDDFDEDSYDLNPTNIHIRRTEAISLLVNISRTSM
jgi:hypothetical protein